ncbi:efflux RND transporter periplasmic adaptor subunit [Solemya velesiana gill symbiont]|uniref:CzcB-like barrel-sandwich hybrid domain-containing protein n=1 Tax=Solemya velesiana gill symbiont TaxID=1918948 RepID=A0A1T2KU96_9GAMM|nr:efflux RND transporter periplasmic adaptor subunit [Solemya velesiana gill symbiont]OOZ36433.1 hypothetical protein BOW51_07105 [Solemya velesiana gill symbiont]
MIRILLVLSALSVSAVAFAEKLEARLEWANRVELAIPLSGVVDKVMVVPGQRVKSGQELLSLDQRLFEANKNKAGALLGEAAQDRAEADRQLSRALELYDQTVLSDYDKNMAEIEMARANALWHTAKAAQVEAQIDLEQSRIAAPFDGVVLSVHAYPGQVVNNQLAVQPLIVLADDTRLVAKAKAPADKLASLKSGQNLKVGVGGAWVGGKVLDLGMDPIDENERGPLYELGVVFNRPETLLVRVGIPVVIRINE